MDYTQSINLTQYQQFVTNGFKEHDTIHMRLFDWTLGLSGETGEVTELLKHSIFHENRLPDKMELAKELADIVWYVTAIAETCEINLEDALKLNMAKLEHRHQGNCFSTQGSNTRHQREQAFKSTEAYKYLKSCIERTEMHA